jgi:hypothetical protein
LIIAALISYSLYTWSIYTQKEEHGHLDQQEWWQMLGRIVVQYTEAWTVAPKCQFPEENPKHTDKVTKKQWSSLYKKAMVMPEIQIKDHADGG